MDTTETMCAVRTPDQERQAVIAEARTWLGTPWHHEARVKGAGVDCAMLLAEVYERAGIIEHVEVGHYPMDWHLHRDIERIVEIVEQYAHPTTDPHAGDVVLFKFGRTFSHGGILVGENSEIIHAVRNVGVILDEWQRVDALSQREMVFYTTWGK
jgi:cell wall-associated NlpC family hydrolase